MSKIDLQIQLLEDIATANHNRRWWEQAMQETMDAIDGLDKVSFSAEKEAQEDFLNNRLLYLIGKKKIEHQIIQNLQDKIAKLRAPA